MNLPDYISRMPIGYMHMIRNTDPKYAWWLMVPDKFMIMDDFGNLVVTQIPLACWMN